MPDDGSGAGEHSISDYYSASQLRSDRWSALRDITESLSKAESGTAAIEKLSLRAKKLFDALDPIEMYWAFPGVTAFEHLRRLLAMGNHDDLAFAVRRAVRALTSGAYRRRSIPLMAQEGDNDDAMTKAR